jgi:DNA-binding ferritin-like protein
MSADIINVLMTLRSQVKIYHWQTMSFARHKATDDLVSSLDGNIDKFVEVYMGKYGRPKFTDKNSKFAVHDAEDKRAEKLLKNGVTWLTHFLPRFLKKEDTDLLNIRDEILGDLNQARFLFGLR